MIKNLKFQQLTLKWQLVLYKISQIILPKNQY